MASPDTGWTRHGRRASSEDDSADDFLDVMFGFDAGGVLPETRKSQMRSGGEGGARGAVRVPPVRRRWWFFGHEEEAPARVLSV